MHNSVRNVVSHGPSYIQGTFDAMAVEMGVLAIPAIIILSLPAGNIDRLPSFVPSAHSLFFGE